MDFSTEEILHLLLDKVSAMDEFVWRRGNMHIKNAAYSQEYIEYRKTFDYVFQDKYRIKIENMALSDGKHSIQISYYDDRSCEFSKYLIHTTQTEVFDNNGKKVSEFRNINHNVNLYSVVQHSNGKSYLIFSIDLYGYSIMNLANYCTYHFIPEESFNSYEETFIWTEVFYCKKNNILAVAGCYWAYPSSVEFFDFTNPEELPYEKIYSSYDMESELNIDTDVNPLRWNDNGSILLSCCIDKEGEKEIEKVVDIESLVRAKFKQS